MKRIAALHDIHGNISALEATLRDLEPAGVDAVVYGGDLALGPFPREVMDLVMSRTANSYFVRGNCDRLVVDAFDGADLSTLPSSVRMLLEWTAGQLDTPHRDFLDAMSPSVTLNVDDLGDVLFCHATPRSDDEIFTIRTPAERVRPMLAGITANTVVCGHTHMQFDRALDGIRVVNAGSVGMPYGRTGAHWLLVGPDIKLVNTSYDLSLAAAGIRSSAYPDAEEFAERYVLSPRSEEEMLQLFER